MKLDNKELLLYGVTDRMWVGEKSLLTQIKESLDGGVTCIQIRENELGKEDFNQEAMQIKAMVDCYEVPLIINDAVQIAIEVGASGVHIGQEDMEIEKARRFIGKEKKLGVSVSTVEEAKEAQKKGADYLGVGAVFTTSTKKDARIVSKELLQKICESVDIPVVAIGGINGDNIEELNDTGIAGVAIVSAIYGQADIELESRKLKEKVDKIISY